MRIRLVGVVFTLIAGSGVLSARDVPWGGHVPGSEKLSEKQKALAAAIFDSTQCYYACEGTVSQNLALNPPCPAAVRIARFIVRQVVAGVPPLALRKQLQNRVVSAHPPRVYDIGIAGLEPRGDPGSPLKVVMYADYECPYCAAAAAALKRIVEEMPHTVVVYFKNFPIKSHPLAVTEAAAAIAADRQGKFWPMHDLLFENREGISEEKIVKLAAHVGLDMPAFEHVRSDSTTLNRIRDEKSEGIALGIKSTPGIFVNGKLYNGAKTHEDLTDRLEEELEMLQLPPERP
jgi:protein-disulfide isomerase